MNRLEAGFSRVNINPMMGIGLQGYFIPRKAEGVLDDLEINTLALRCGETAAVLMSVDHCGIRARELDVFRRGISQVTGVPLEGVYIHATHTHTGPFLFGDTEDPLEQEYYRFMLRRFNDAAVLALEDCRPARMGWRVGEADGIAFVRRYRMKDGTVRTNPGMGNPDIAAPIGEADKRVNVLRFDREKGSSIVAVNIGIHPDAIGGSRISADWPGFARRTVEKAVDHTRCLVFNGAQGDINHVNPFAKGGDLNGMSIDFDGVYRGYGHARHMGRTVAGAVLQVYDKVHYTDVDSIRCASRRVEIPANRPDPGDLPRAYRIDQLHREGRDAELPYKEMELTTAVAEAQRMIRLAQGPDVFPLSLHALAIGGAAFVGIPGEPFSEVGRQLKLAEGWQMVLPTCNTNDKAGYFPVQEAYDEGGYEARSSPFKAGVAERLTEGGLRLLDSLR